MPKIAVISPVVDLEHTKKIYQQTFNLPQVDFEMLGVGDNLSGIATAFDYALIAPEIIRTAYTAAESGANAILINCATEPGIMACRELLTIPVFDIAELSLEAAAQQDGKFAIMTPFFHADYKRLLQAKLTELLDF